MDVERRLFPTVVVGTSELLNLERGLAKEIGELTQTTYNLVYITQTR